MKLDELEHLWRRHASEPRGPIPAAAIQRLRDEADAAARRFRGMMVMAALLFFLGWAVSMLAHVSAVKRLTTLQATTLLIGSAFYIVWWTIALRSRRAVLRERERMGGTVHESLEASWRTVRLQIQNYRIAGALLPLAVVATAALSFAKTRAGELPLVGAWVSTLAMAAAALIVGISMWVRYVRELRPRRAELERALQGMEADE